jgi:ADP-ribose pyrophosphatase YjhB (NUDIX family)
MDRRETKDDTFYDMADRFLELADDVHQVLPRGQVTSVFLFAAARYAADDWLVRTLGNKADADCIEQMRARFEQMLEENLADLRAYYEETGELDD